MHATRWRRLAVASAAAALALSAVVPQLRAHKPITSPFTFYDDVLPITRAKCAACHAPDGVAPMSLLTHADAVPWGESMKLELIAGHMPPWSNVVPRDAFRHTPQLTARELNVLLTWAVGGTPPGEETTPAAPMGLRRSWPLGPPDATAQLPEALLDANTPSASREFVLPFEAAGRRLAAVDFLPGTPALVRNARVSVRRGPVEQVVSLWVPGDEPLRLPNNSGWSVEAGSELAVRVSYKKRWDREREPATDQSQVALYFVPAGRGGDATFATLVAGGDGDRESTSAGMVLRARTDTPNPVTVAAVWPEAALAGSRVRLEKSSTDGTRMLIAAFEPRAGWERRYWLTNPLALATGDTLHLTTSWPPGTQPPPSGTRLLGADLVPTRP